MMEIQTLIPIQVSTLTVTEDGETETNPCTVTSTSLTVMFSEY